jgi:hypothetical protein
VVKARQKSQGLESNLAMRVLKAIKAVWLRFAAILAKVNTAILLTLIYFLVIMPASLIVRIGRVDLMGRRIGEEPSFWRDPEWPSMDIEDCRRQF